MSEKCEEKKTKYNIKQSIYALALLIRMNKKKDNNILRFIVSGSEDCCILVSATQNVHDYKVPVYAYVYVYGLPVAISFCVVLERTFLFCDGTK